MQRYPDSMLGTMFSGRDGIVVPVDEQGFAFIDRSGAQFGVILDFLRTGKVRLPLGAAARAELADEADFYLLRAHMEGAPGWRRSRAEEDAPKSVMVCTHMEFESLVLRNGHVHEAALNAAMKKEPDLKILSTSISDTATTGSYLVTILASHHEAGTP